jgi:hypothetical protein
VNRAIDIELFGQGTAHQKHDAPVLAGPHSTAHTLFDPLHDLREVFPRAMQSGFFNPVDTATNIGKTIEGKDSAGIPWEINAIVLVDDYN